MKAPASTPAIRIGFIPDPATGAYVIINLIFRLADLLIVSFLFDHTSNEGDTVP
jgi:hypothetical protein